MRNLLLILMSLFIISCSNLFGEGSDYQPRENAYLSAKNGPGLEGPNLSHQYDLPDLPENPPIITIYPPGSILHEETA